MRQSKAIIRSGRSPFSSIEGAWLHRMTHAYTTAGFRGAWRLWWLVQRIRKPPTRAKWYGFGVPIELRLEEPEAQPQLYRGLFELGERTWVSQHVARGGLYVDVGANIGIWSICLSGLAGSGGHVYAFEPSPGAFSRLRANTAHCGNVTLVNKAVGAARSTLVLAESSGDFMHSTLLGHRKGVRRHAVEVLTLDEVFMDEHIEFLKCDVEGFEPYVLQGMTNILRELRVNHCLFEVAFEYSNTDCEWVYDLLEMPGYRCFALHRTVSLFKNTWRAQPDVRGYMGRRESFSLIVSRVDLSLMDPANVAS